MSKHARFFARTVMVQNGNYEMAYRALDRYEHYSDRLLDTCITESAIEIK